MSGKITLNGLCVTTGSDGTFVVNGRCFNDDGTSASSAHEAPVIVDRGDGKHFNIVCGAGITELHVLGDKCHVSVVGPVGSLNVSGTTAQNTTVQGSVGAISSK